MLKYAYIMQNTNVDAVVLNKIITQINGLKTPDVDSVQKILFKNPLKNQRVPRKSIVLAFFNDLVDTQKSTGTNVFSFEEIKKIRLALQMKTTRTISGVTPVTVLTKPFPCPGKCIFCPSDVMMPKSYLSSEPGAQRAFANKFDPYYQTYNRLCAYAGIGHPTDKIELIILGGTWSVYPKEYQIWFVKRCFDAMNDFDADTFEFKNPEATMPYDENATKDDVHETTYNKQVSKRKVDITTENATYDELFISQKINETAKSRCVGLVVETRPEYVTDEELIHTRKLGATKVQMGIQSLNDEVLELNKRGHTVEETKNAFKLLRKYGFKIHGHWMPNLYGSTPEKDIEDYKKLFTPDFCPDELKIYPCSLIETAELMNYYKKDLWHPYSEQELSKVLVEVFKNTPRYCRLTRVIRDIPSQEIVVGNKKTNFRQVIEQELKNQNIKPVEIRSREVRGKLIGIKDLDINIYEYPTSTTKELFIEYITKADELAGFLRLSLPFEYSFDNTKSAMIREIHVYGQSIEIGLKEDGSPQHTGLGKSLIEKAKQICKAEGFANLYVISSVGTREYYKKRGFVDSGLYQKLVTT